MQKEIEEFTVKVSEVGKNLDKCKKKQTEIITKLSDL